MPVPVHIARGQRGESVRDLKSRLAALGFDVAGVEAPDEFGPGTEAALRSFQGARGLRVDGICGPQTWSALVESGYSLGDRMLYLRQPMLRGDDVAELQRRLNALGFDAGKEDGILGPQTVEALREFQRNAGITVDGICGPETVASLRRVGRDHEGSVAVAREREVLRHAARDLAGYRIFLAAEPELLSLGEIVRHGLAAQRAHVVLETSVADQSELAGEANRFEADLVLLLRLGDSTAPSCAFYESGGYRSERGSLTAQSLLSELAPVLGADTGEPRGKTYALLRETRAPAVVCEPVVAGDTEALVARTAEFAEAIVRGVRRSVEEPVER